MKMKKITKFIISCCHCTSVRPPNWSGVLSISDEDKIIYTNNYLNKLFDKEACVGSLDAQICSLKLFLSVCRSTIFLSTITHATFKSVINLILKIKITTNNK